MQLAGGGIEPYVTQLLTADVATPMSREYIDITLAAYRDLLGARTPTPQPPTEDISDH